MAEWYRAFVSCAVDSGLIPSNVKPKTIYLMTGNSCLIYYVTALFVYKRSFTPFRSDTYEGKPRSQDLLHAFFAPNALFLDKIGHKTLKNHKKRS